MFSIVAVKVTIGLSCWRTWNNKTSIAIPGVIAGADTPKAGALDSGDALRMAALKKMLVGWLKTFKAASRRVRGRYSYAGSCIAHSRHIPH